MSNDDRPNVLLDRSIWGPLFPSLREAIDKRVCPPGVAAAEQFDPRNYKTWLIASDGTRRSMSNAPKPDRQNDPTFSIMLEQLTDVCNQRDDALAEIDRLTEERDNARANAKHFAAMLNQRDAPKPTEPSLTPDGALAPIPRGTAHGGMLAALRGASKG